MQEQEFNSFADDYREIHTQNVQGISGQDSDYFSEYKIEELAARGAAAKDAAWLDLGCGDGNTFRFVKQFYPDASYKGIDVSSESIKVASEKYSSEGQDIFSIYDGKNIPFDDNTFDIVYMACVMHHIMPEDRQGILQECRRVLKKDGQIIIFEHNPKNPVTMKVVNNCVFDENAVLLHYGECKRRLLEAGFSDVKKRYTIFFPRKGIFNKLLGMEKALSWIPMGGQYYAVARPAKV